MSDSMHEDLAQFKCTCGSQSSWDHIPTCALWDSTEFENGRGVWDAKDQELYSIFDDDVNEEDLDNEEAPQAASSLHTSDEDEIGGKISDTISEEDVPTGVITTGDVVYSSSLIGDEGMTAYIEEAIDSWLGTESDEPPNFSYRGVTWVWDAKVAQWEAKPLGCYCEQSVARQSTKGTGQEVEECLNCMVKRPLYKTGAGKWKQVTYLKDEIGCECSPPSGWFCNKCKVRRNQEWMPWEKGTTMSSTSGGLAKTYGGGQWQTYDGSATTYVQKCRHYGQMVTMPNGRKFMASSHHRRTDAEIEEGLLPDFGFYLDSIWKPQVLAWYVPWTDHGTPQLDWFTTMKGLEAIDKLAQTDHIVEIGCIGGHGRTGTVLAILSLMNGVETALEAIDYVHDNYCDCAIEGAKQEWFIEWAEAHLRGRDLPIMPTFSNFGQKKADRSKNKGKKVGINKDGKGQFYCNECQTDTKQTPEVLKDETTWPTHCWWCEGEFKYATPEEKKPAPKATKGSKKASSSSGKPSTPAGKAKQSQSGSTGSSRTGTAHSDPKVVALAAKEPVPSAEALGVSGEEYGRQIWRLVLNRLWPLNRVKVWQAPDVFRCGRCSDKVSWRYRSAHRMPGWVHRTDPEQLIDLCNKPEGSKSK